MPDYTESLTDSRTESLTESLRTMSRFLVGDENVGDTLRRITELAVEAIEAADLAGITLQGERGPRTAVFSDAEAPEIDQAQYDTGVGPCLDALRLNQVFRIEDTAHDARWRRFSQACFAHGIQSTLALPLAVSETRAIGALNLYSRQPAAFVADEQSDALIFAEQAAVVLSHAHAYQGGSQLSPQMQEALASRAVIGRAQGVLMGRTSCTAEEAFEMLRRASRGANVSLREAAHNIIKRAQGLQQ